MRHGEASAKKPCSRERFPGKDRKYMIITAANTLAEYHEKLAWDPEGVDPKKMTSEVTVL